MKTGKRTRGVLSAVALLTVIILAACGSAAAPSTGSTGDASTAPAAAENGGEQITLRVTTWGTPAEKAAWDRGAERFEQSHPNINVEVEGIPTDYDTKLTTMIAGNQEPDIAMMESASIAFPLAEEGHFLNLKDFLDADPGVMGPDDTVPNLYYYSDPGVIAGIGAGPETFVLYYNQEMFEEAGVTPPPAKADEAWTWDQFVEAAKLMTIDENGNNAASADFDPERIQQYGVNIGLWWGAWSNFVFSNGGDFISEDGSQFTLNQPEAVEALQNVADLINVHHVMPSPVQAKNVPATNIALQTKKVAMVIDGQWASQDIALSKVPYNVGVLPVMGEPVTTMVTGMFVIFKSSEHPQEAWQLLQELLNPESSLDLIQSGLLMPAQKDWYTDSSLLAKWTETDSRPSGYEGAVIDMLLNHSHQTPTAYVKNFNKIMDVVNPALDKVWSGEQSVQEAMDAVAEQAQAQVQGRRDSK